MKTHILNRSLLVLALSSSALVAATPTAVQMPQAPAMPVQRTAAIAMPGVFTERDAGTPISIPLNGRFLLSLHTDSKVDPVGSFWRPAFGTHQNFQLMMRDKTTNNWFDQGSEKQISNTFFTFKPLLAGQTELSFELVQWVPAASGSVNANRSTAGDFTVIRTVTFNNMTVVDAGGECSAERAAQGSAQGLAHDLSTGSW
jgi:hypothetical protein